MSRRSRTVNVGGVVLGGGNPVVVQSMTNTDTADVDSTLAQISRLHRAGCQLVRVAVSNRQVVPALAAIRRRSPVPLIADIHFDHTLALHALEAGFDKLRLNPGTLANKAAVREVARGAAQRRVPIRIGVNSGSIHSHYRHLPRLQALVESACHYCQLLEEQGFTDIVVSLKSSSVVETYRANQEFAARTEYPLHLGVTEAGPASVSIIKSAIGIGSLLLQGVGDTIRVSVTGPPEEEVPIALGILRALGLRQGVDVISCPTCGRTGHDLAAIVSRVQQALADVDIPLTVAVMGCPVNGPGEAQHADLGIAYGREKGVLFKKGEVVCQLPNHLLADALLAAVEAEKERCREGRG